LVAHPQEAPGHGQNDAKVVHLLPVLIELLFRLFLGDAVSLLDFADELITLSGNYIQIIVGEFAPFLLNLAFELLPVSGYLIPVHNLPPLRLFLKNNKHQIELVNFCEYMITETPPGKESGIWVGPQ
jgi:hypothetical protein